MNMSMLPIILIDLLRQRAAEDERIEYKTGWKAWAEFALRRKFSKARWRGRYARPRTN